MRCLAVFSILLAACAVSSSKEPTTQDKIIAAAEAYLDEPYVFGGRDGRFGCRRGKRRVRCPGGIDCQSLIFFAYEKVTKTPWTRYSVMPSVCVKKNQLGRPVRGLDGVLRSDLDHEKLNKGDVLFFLWKNYNLETDRPLWTKGEDQYGVWHTGMVHGRKDEVVQVIHAKPGERVVIEPLDDVDFDALFVVRLSNP
jgi:cell wall-associated NlpC family hydrolase